MMTAVTSLMARSLRMDARSLLNHVTRFGLLAGIYISLSCALAIASRFGAPGLRFFTASVYLNVIFLTLLGIGFFSTTITEEKEEDTLGLMLMAGIRPLGLLLGKLGGRLVQALLLVIVQYPLTLLAVTMGGVSTFQVQAAYVGIISYMLMLAGGGLLCSTIAPRSRTAGTWMVIALGIYTLVPYLCRELYKYGGYTSWSGRSFSRDILELSMSGSLFLRIESILSSGFGESPWSLQAFSNSLIGLVCFGLSWCCFGLATRTLTSEATSRGAITRSATGLSRSFSPGRVWNNPFLWKDFHFVAGGLSMRLLRIVFYAALFLMSWGLAELWGMTRWGDDAFTHVIGVFQFFMMFALSWETALLSARCVHDEIRGQTLASLVMLPRATAEVFYSKLFGAMLGAYPGIVVFVAANLIGLKNTEDFIRHAPVLFFIGHFLLVPHLAAVYALWVRWGAVPLAIGTMIGLATMWIVVGEVIMNIHGEGFFNFIGFLVLIVCAACHWLVLSRIRHIAERG